MADIPITLLFQSVGGDGIKNELSSMMGTLTKIKDIIVDLARQSDQYGDVMAHLKTPIDEASAALSGQVDKLTLAIGANRAAQAGLVLTSNEFRAVAVRAKEFADANGMEFEPALQKLVGVLVRGKDRLHEFGMEAQGQGAMIQELAEKYGEATVAIGGNADAMDALDVKWQEFKRHVGEGVDAGGPLSSLIGMLGTLIEGFDQLGSAVTRAIDRMQQAWADWLPSYIDFQAAWDRSHNQLIEGVDVPGDESGGHPMGIRIDQDEIPRFAGPPEATAEERAAARRGGGGGGRSRAATPGRAETGDELAASLGGAGSRENRDEPDLGGDEGDLDSWLRHQSAVYTSATKVEGRYTHEVKSFAEARSRARMAELDAMGSYVQIAAGFFGELASRHGASASALHLIEATSEGVLAAIAWAKVANPYGGVVHLPEALAHTGAALLALEAAANPSKPNIPGGGGGGGGSGGGQPASAIGGASGGGGGGRSTSITINMGPGLSSSSDVRRAVMRAIVEEADHGRPLPYRAVRERR